MTLYTDINTSEFEGRVAIVTGATSGIGVATAQRFAALGASVVVAGRSASAAEKTMASISKNGGTAVTKLGDITDSAYCDDLVAMALDRFGQLDVIVNAAGVNHRADAASTSDDEWSQVMSTNLDAVFALSRAAVNTMVDAGRGGAIVNLGSTVGSVGTKGMAAYCASKGAVHQLTRAMALDHAANGIRINAVAPGAVNTPMLPAGHPQDLSIDDVLAANIAAIPLGRIPEPAAVAELITFLASDAAAHITGAIIPIDGGYTAQ